MREGLKRTGQLLAVKRWKEGRNNAYTDEDPGYWLFQATSGAVQNEDTTRLPGDTIRKNSWVVKGKWHDLKDGSKREHVLSEPEAVHIGAGAIIGELDLKFDSGSKCLSLESHEALTRMSHNLANIC